MYKEKISELHLNKNYHWRNNWSCKRHRHCSHYCFNNCRNFRYKFLLSTEENV